MNEDEQANEFNNEEHEAYIKEHEDIQPDEDYEMRLRALERKKLWGLAAAKCSICKCDLFLKEESDTNVGEECHISSHKPDYPSAAFSRHIEALKEDFRDKSYDNAILLCSIHHKVIDNPKSTLYTIEKLHQIKAEHEVWVLEKLKENTNESYELKKRNEEIIRKIRIYENEFGLDKERYGWLKRELGKVVDESVLRSLFSASTTKYLEDSLENYGREIDMPKSCPYCHENLVYDHASNSMYCRKCDKHID